MIFPMTYNSNDHSKSILNTPLTIKSNTRVIYCTKQNPCIKIIGFNLRKRYRSFLDSNWIEWKYQISMYRITQWTSLWFASPSFYISDPKVVSCAYKHRFEINGDKNVSTNVRRNAENGDIFADWVHCKTHWSQSHTTAMIIFAWSHIFIFCPSHWSPF